MSQDTDGGGGGTEVAASRGTAAWRGTETKTHHCQPLRHRNRHPPLRETLNHFYCIELSLLPAERTSKRALSLLLAPSSPLPLHPLPGYLSLSRSSSRAFRQVTPGPRSSSSPSCRLRSLSLFAHPFPSPHPVSPSPTTGPRDNTNAKAFTPLWLPKWNKFFNSRIYRRANESSALSPR